MARRWRGRTNVTWDDKDIIKLTERALANVNRDTAEAVKDEAVKDLSGRPGAKGKLKEQIKVSRRKHNRSDYIVSVPSGRIISGGGLIKRIVSHYKAIVNKERFYYSKFVEFGTRTRPPRPFLRPALKRLKRRHLKAVKDILR